MAGTDATDDDASDASSGLGDDILYYSSQPSPRINKETTAQQTEAQSDSKDDETAFVKTDDDPPQPLPSDNAVDEAKAQRTAASVTIEKRLDSPSSLYWHVHVLKKKKTLFPCRIPPNENEYIGYKDQLRVKDPNKQTVVQYVQFPHLEFTTMDVGRYSVVSKSQLVPYHGGGSPEAWCSTLSDQYFKQLLQKHKKVGLGMQQIRVEKLYLQRVLNKAKEELDSREDLKQYDIAAEVPEELKAQEQKAAAAAAPVVTTQDDDSNSESDDHMRRSKRSRTNNDDENKQRLRVGDVILFYKPGTTFGQGTPLKATITAINPKDEYKLTLECDGEFCILIPKDQNVRRFKRNVRGKLVECDDWQSTKFWPLETFTMKKEGAKDASKKAAEKHVAQISSIIQRNKEIAMSNIEKDGCGPTDMLR